MYYYLKSVKTRPYYHKYLYAFFYYLFSAYVIYGCTNISKTNYVHETPNLYDNDEKWILGNYVNKKHDFKALKFSSDRVNKPSLLKAIKLGSNQKIFFVNPSQCTALQLTELRESSCYDNTIAMLEEQDECLQNPFHIMATNAAEDFHANLLVCILNHLDAVSPKNQENRQDDIHKILHTKDQKFMNVLDIAAANSNERFINELHSRGYISKDSAEDTIWLARCCQDIQQDIRDASGNNLFHHAATKCHGNPKDHKFSKILLILNRKLEQDSEKLVLKKRITNYLHETNNQDVTPIGILTTNRCNHCLNTLLKYGYTIPADIAQQAIALEDNSDDNPVVKVLNEHIKKSIIWKVHENITPLHDYVQKDNIGDIKKYLNTLDPEECIQTIYFSILPCYYEVEQNYFGRCSPFDIVVYKNNVEAVEVLLEYTKEIGMPNDEVKHTLQNMIQDYISSVTKYRCLKMVELLNGSWLAKKESKVGGKRSDDKEKDSSKAGQSIEQTEEIQLKKCKWSTCAYTINKNNDLYKHANEHVKNLNSNFKCESGGCNKTFRRKRTLDTDMKTHTGEKEHKCTFIDENGKKCDKAFNQKNNLDTHRKIHTGEKEHKCTFIDENGKKCDKAFNKNANLKRHRKIHTGEKEHKCTFIDENGKKCDKAFNQRNHLDRHIKKLHPHFAFVSPTRNKRQKTA